MKDDTHALTATAPGKEKTPQGVSERKLKANRANAKKSTGPRTARGKALSRRNAVKHGLFARDLFPLLQLPTESGQDFQDLRDQLREEHQPVGNQEEWQVDRIAICKWRLRLAWLYENAEINSAVVDVSVEKLRWSLEAMKKGDEPVLALLQDAKKEIQTGGEISQELKTRIIEADARLPEIWRQCEERAQQVVEQTARLVRKNEKEYEKLTPEILGRAIAHLTIDFVRSHLDNFVQTMFDTALKVSCDQRAIPNRDAVDKLIRYEAAAERNLGRALDRLERLQRRRTGEAVPPPLNVNLRRN